MDEAFNEEVGFSTRLDPLTTCHADFPFDEVSQNLGDIHSNLGLSDEEAAKLGTALKEILRWAADVHLRPGCEDLVARRILALAWVLDPALLEDTPSLSTMARKLGYTPARISHFTTEATRRFGIRNRSQSHGWNRKEGDPELN